MNYDTLKTTLASYSFRDDLTALMSTFIMLAESRANRELRCYQMEEVATSTPTDEFLALPADFLAIKALQLNTSPQIQLQYVSQSVMDSFGVTTGTPARYTLSDNQIEINPTAEGQSVSLTYYKNIPALSDSNTTNWLLAAYPDYYIEACLMQIKKYERDPEWKEKEQQIAQMEAMINKRGKVMDMAGTPLVVVAV